MTESKDTGTVKPERLRDFRTCEGIVEKPVTVTLEDGTEVQTTEKKKCGSRGELKKVGKHLLCHSCRRKVIEKSHNEKERERW